MTKNDIVQKVLEITRSKLGKDAQEAIMRFGDKPTARHEAIPTGSLALDMALGCGGFPRGRLIEAYGPESSGKTTLFLHAVAAAQRQGLVCAFVDAEHALDPGYATKLGVNMDDLLLSQPDNGEQALEVTETLVRSGCALIVVDSVAALTPKAEIEGEMGDHHVGLQARMMSQACRKLAAITHHQNATVMFINQIRYKIGVLFGSPETTTGGNALKFYASVRLDIRRIKTLRVGGGEGDDSKGEAIGSRTKVKVVKNKMAPPFREAEFNIMYGTGIDRSLDLLEVASGAGIVERSGSWYSYKGEKLGNGLAAACANLATSAVRTSIEADVRKLAEPAEAPAVVLVATKS